MIHSLSGGVIKENGNHTFIKVESLGYPLWLICDGFEVEVGDVAVYEDRKGDIARGKVVRVDKNVSSQCSPFPMSKMKSVLKIEKP